jgi:hypothetical protein
MQGIGISDAKDTEARAMHMRKHKLPSSTHSAAMSAQNEADTKLP